MLRNPPENENFGKIHASCLVPDQHKALPGQPNDLGITRRPAFGRPGACLR